ncbi:hypothetical protein [Alteraurantiacibacter buctensis]|uniref:Uncharacterized protein n=1 Tax=Alteraurantiacibacter buctensis TaxID=1503981 RepID=A0A844Z292_9SPHN|nr:hypothetical protein [Alteraurantiacibacter buctensis]MXO73468.1 hypothetical protein [Alteraurantiacibacter buctensis]
MLAGRTSVEAAWQVVVGTGWFMPGMCAVAAPPLALDPQAPYWLLRGRVWLVNMAPPATLAAILLWRHWRDCQPVVQQDGAARWLERVPLAYAVLLVAVAGAVLLA